MRAHKNKCGLMHKYEHVHVTVKISRDVSPSDWASYYNVMAMVLWPIVPVCVSLQSCMPPLNNII